MRAGRLTCRGLVDAYIRRINAYDKKVPPYDQASRNYRKRATLLAEGPKNPSLAAFLSELKARAIALKVDE